MILWLGLIGAGLGGGFISLVRLDDVRSAQHESESAFERAWTGGSPVIQAGALREQNRKFESERRVWGALAATIPSAALLAGLAITWVWLGARAGRTDAEKGLA